MHIGLIMDGNGRWANQRSLPRTAGHIEGVKTCKRIMLAALKLKIDYLTLYVFSTENWKRPDQEVSYLMMLIAKKIPGETDFCIDNNIRIKIRGNMEALPKEARIALEQCVERTSSCNGITVILAVNYGGQDEIARAATKFINKTHSSVITPHDIEANLDNPDVPAPDMIARSAGEMRLSNFMLWDSAYAEFLAIEKLWPDWTEDDLRFCLDELAKRNRKFGGLQ